MEKIANGNVSALKDHLLNHNKVSQLDSLILFGVQRLPNLINSMKREGFTIQSERTSMIKVLVRINKYCTLVPPKNVPTKKIFLTVFWIQN